MSAVADKSYRSYHAFMEADERRASSPEWDFGCHWHEDGRNFPMHRVSWVVETGELYVTKLGHRDAGSVRVLVVIPPVGDYPYGKGHDAWVAFKNEQPVEELLDGWADESGGDLDWLRARVRNYENERGSA